MHASTLLLGLVATLTSTTLAAQHPPQPAQVAAAIQARGTIECLSVATSVLPKWTDIPIPPATLASYFGTAVSTETDSCKVPTVTGAVGTVYSQYMSSISSWTSKHFDEIRSLVQLCSDVPEVASQIPSGAACSSALAPFTSVSKAWAPRETGMMAAAALAAGVVVAAI
jgi:hypothetical protein